MTLPSNSARTPSMNDAIVQILTRERPAVADHEQPRQAGVGMKTRFRHYVNLDQTENRLRALLGEFKFAPLSDVFASDLASLQCA